MALIFGNPTAPYIDIPLCRITYCEVLPKQRVLYLTSYGTVGIIF